MSSAADAAAAAAAAAPMPDVRAPPRGVKYGSLLPLGVKGKQVTRKFFPNNGSTFQSNSNNVIRIPLNGPFFLNAPDSYLYFEMFVNGLPPYVAPNVAENCYLDSSAHSVIQRLRIEGPDGAELERIEDYNVLHAMLLDYQSGNSHNSTTRIYEKTAARVSAVGLDVTSTDRQASFIPAGNAVAPNRNIGGEHDMIYQLGNPQMGLGGQVLAFAATDYSTVASSPVDAGVLNMNGGFAMNPVFPAVLYCDATRSANHTASGNAVAVGLKLVSGILKNSRYLPLLALKGSGLTLEITLADHRTAFCNTSGVAAVGNAGLGGGGSIQPTATALTAPDAIAAGNLSSYTLQNVEYVGSTIDFDEAFTATFMAMVQANGLIQFHGVSFHSFIWTFTKAAAMTEVIPIALRARSLKGILCGLRQNSMVNQQDSFSIGRRINGNLSQYVWNIGSIRLPQAPVTMLASKEGMVQAYCEIVKMFSSFNSLDYAGRVEMGQYFDAGFAIGVDTEAYSQDTSLLESGMDTSSQSLPVRLELTFSALNGVRLAGGQGGYWSGGVMADSTNQIVRADIYGMVDVIYSVTADGLMTASD